MYSVISPVRESVKFPERRTLTLGIDRLQNYWSIALYTHSLDFIFLKTDKNFVRLNKIQKKSKNIVEATE